MDLYCDEEPDTLISFNVVYNDEEDLSKNTSFLFDFQVSYTLAPEENSDGEEDLNNLETRTIHQTHEFDRDWLIGGNKDDIQANIYQILYMIDVPSYKTIVNTLSYEIWNLKERDVISTLPKVERINVDLDVIVWSFPGDDDGDDMVDVKLAVAPASEEAVENHLETVVVDKEGYCVICMDKIRVGSDVAAGQMPCMHVFHRTCGEDWLRISGICPVCRLVFPI